MSISNSKDETVIQEILEAARDLFSRYGLKKTTMDDVGKATGKGKSTLYYYYPGKTELFEAVVNVELKKHLQDIRQAMNAETSSKGKLKAFLVTRLKLKERLHNLSEVVYNDVFDNYKEICRIKEYFESVQIELIKEIVVGGMQGGEFKEMSSEEISFFSTWTAAAFSGLETPSNTSGQLVQSHECCNRIVDLILFGIGK